MGDWIGLGIFVLVIAGAVAGLSFLGKARPPMTDEEFERRAAEARGTMSAGVAGVMYSLQKLTNPRAAEAVEVQKDLRAGFYDDQLLIDGGGPGGREGEGAGGPRAGDEPAVRRGRRGLAVEEEGEDDA
ncbi:MAG TPA: hypothetical protein VN228_17370 [Pyrinomonadaceae bacterium]|nr:hypothetical protein [Pyrinomonadaceae bacterium]